MEDVLRFYTNAVSVYIRDGLGYSQIFLSGGTGSHPSHKYYDMCFLGSTENIAGKSYFY